jgi:tetratricopeptide (TPR) repeat protein
MAIRGSLREASFADVLQLLAMGRKTGCLSVTNRGQFGQIYFEEGRISFATIVNRRDRLGDILVKSRVITAEQLNEAVAAQDSLRDVRLGEILVSRGLLSREELQRHVRTQIEEAVYHLFTWKDGTFNFEPDLFPDDQDMLVSISPESLLLEGARRVDEWTLIAQKVPGMDTIFALDKTHLTESGAELTPEQQTILSLVDGRRDVQALVDESGLVEFEVGKALYGLVIAGFLHKVGRSEPRETAEGRESRVDEHRNLGVAFYKTGMLDEATREFRRVLELRRDDLTSRFYMGLALLRQGKWTDALAMLESTTRLPEAPASAFHNLAYVLERLGRYEEARAALSTAIEKGLAGDARVHTSLGALALREGKVEEADRILSEARPMWGKRRPSAAWFHYGGLAAALSGDLNRAIDILEEGVRLHPHAAALYNNLAVALDRRGDHDESLRTAEQGLLQDPSLAQLHKNVGDGRYRAGRYEEALDAYRRAVRNDESLGSDVYLKLGNIHYRRQELSDAVKCWERALELDPDNAIVRSNLDAVRRTIA